MKVTGPRGRRARRAVAPAPSARALAFCLVLAVSWIPPASLARTAAEAEDDAFWESVRGCTDAVEVELYVTQFSEGGRHIKEARACLARLRQPPPPDSEVSEKGRTPASKTAEQSEVEKLLELCELHFEQDRLTAGGGGTAVECYQEVLSRDRLNRQAWDGLRRVFEKYARWAREAVGSGDAGRARGFLKKLEALNAEAPEVWELEGAIAGLEKARRAEVAASAQRRARRQALAEKLGREFSPAAVWVNGWTDLHWAAALDLPELARELVEQGMDVDVRLDESGEPFSEESKRMLRELGLNFDTWTSAGDTPLAVASNQNSYAVAKLLVEHGADVNAKSSGDSGVSPLLEAAASESLAVAKLLVEHGADVNPKRTPAGSPLHQAAYSNDLPMVEFLVEKGADLNAGVDEINSTPLHWAVWTHPAQRFQSDRNWAQALAVVKYLIGQGADVNAFSESAGTPLNRAMCSDGLPVVKYFIGQGAQVWFGDDEGWTALHLAADCDALSVAEYLVGQGADVNARNDEGMTPLHSTASWGVDSLSVAEYLVGQGADVNARNDEGMTPLHVAAEFTSPTVVKYLVGQGADIKARNGDGKTPLDVAIERQQTGDYGFILGEDPQLAVERAKEGRDAIVDLLRSQIE